MQVVAMDVIIKVVVVAVMPGERPRFAAQQCLRSKHHRHWTRTVASHVIIKVVVVAVMPGERPGQLRFAAQQVSPQQPPQTLDTNGTITLTPAADPQTRTGASSMGST